MTLKTFQIHGSLRGPNPVKVAIVLAELDLPYEVINIPHEELKGSTFTALNPNGRVPALVDPNNDNFTIWESGAIINYLVSEYDPENKLSFAPHTKEHHLTQQWLHFQMSGQGPYYGQGYWFQHAHSEKLPSAIERYANEAKRVTGVLESWLAEGDKPFLVGEKCTFADLAFIPWQSIMPTLTGVDEEKDYPHVHRWLEGMKSRPTVAKVFKDREEYMASLKK